MLYFIILLSFFYLVVIFSLFKAILANAKRNNFEYVKFSIIIAAKNEEKNISQTLNSLINQNYPQELYEIIIVDDNSTDNTYSIAFEYSQKYSSIKVLKAENKTLPAKKGVLDIGVKNSQYDYILITDADCIAEKDWLISMAKTFSNGYDIVVGKAPFFNQNNFTSLISLYENLKTFIVSHFAISINFAYTATARNFGYTKTIYHKINGYNNTLDTLSGDDDMFIREATKHNAKICGLYYENSSVFSYPKNNLKEYYQQKARHTSTSFYYQTKHQIFLSIWHIFGMFYILSIPLIFIDLQFIYLAITSLICNLLLSIIFQPQLKYNFNIFIMIILDFIYQINLIINFFTGYFYNNKWK